MHGGMLGEKGPDIGNIILEHLARIKLFGGIESVAMRLVGVVKIGGGRFKGELLLEVIMGIHRLDKDKRNEETSYLVVKGN